MLHKLSLRRGKGRVRILILALTLAAAAFHYLFQPRYFRRQQQTDSRCGGIQGCFAGVVTRVVDGDTLDVNGVRIRLVLVDAPERDTPQGPAATAYLRRLCPVGSTALVDQDDLQRTDAYGRTLGVIWCGNTRVNEEMIRAGHARLYRRFCRQSEFGLEPWAMELGCQ